MIGIVNLACSFHFLTFDVAAGLAGDDDHAGDVQQDAEAPQQADHGPEHPDDGGVDAEILGNTCADTVNPLAFVGFV